MRNFEFVLTCENGIHARPAGQLVKFCQTLSSTVSIAKNGKKADAKRLFAVMKLDAKKGDSVQFLVEGENEAEEAESLKKYCMENL
jgi:phosphotransferase system HPr (HPr) family protein